MPVRVAVTAGTVADCTQAIALIDGIAAQFLLADRGYDSNAIEGENHICVVNARTYYSGIVRRME
jgi:hypothetical protein